MTSVGLSKFVTETDVEEAKRKRQEEWERVRRPDDPKEAPEPEMNDIRPLYTRLEEQRLKKEAEREESRQLKNLVRGLDTDEADFLEKVDDLRAKQERQQAEEERRELEEIKLRTQFARKAAEPEPIEPKKTKKPADDTVKRSGQAKSQAKLLAGAIKRKVSESNLAGGATSNDAAPAASAEGNDDAKRDPVTRSGDSVAPQDDAVPPANKAMCVLGVLSGLGSYETDSSEVDSDGSSEDEVCGASRDILGRRPNQQ